MNINFKIAEQVNRERAKREGFYDGRFRPRIVPDKKKCVHIKLRKDKRIEIQ
jgi:hypothetical protein